MGTSLGVFDLNLLLCVQETIIGPFYSFHLKQQECCHTIRQSNIWCIQNGHVSLHLYTLRVGETFRLESRQGLFGQIWIIKGP